jgi:hypothetical protein
LIAAGQTAYAMPASPAAVFRDRILRVTLYVAILTSSVVAIEPAPYDFLMGLLALLCIVCAAGFDRLLVVPLVLLLVWNAAGAASLMPAIDQDKAISYVLTSVDMAAVAMVFACLFTENSVRRLDTLRSAYVTTAVIAAICGSIGYLKLVPGAYDLFTGEERAQGLFKDPNVFGPFLIWPALIVIERMITRRIGILSIGMAGALLLGLLLSFSRGAWFNFAVSGLILVALLFLTAPTPKLRMRIVLLTALAIGLLAAFVVVLLSFDSIGAMFKERANLFNSYDVGGGGRFTLQELALHSLLTHPNGMGPFGFALKNGLQQHNVYLQGFIVYGWVGGIAYIFLVAATAWVGFVTSLMRSPWQNYQIAAFAAFVGVALEGFIIDTDHWRSYFLILGMVWGLAAATLRQRRHAMRPAPMARPQVA